MTIEQKDVIEAFGLDPWAPVEKRNYRVLNYFCAQAAKSLKASAPYLPDVVNSIIKRYPYITAGICAKGMAWAFAPKLTGGVREKTFDKTDYQNYFPKNEFRYGQDWNGVMYPRVNSFVTLHAPIANLLIALGVIYECCYLQKLDLKKELQSAKVKDIFLRTEEWMKVRESASFSDFESIQYLANLPEPENAHPVVMAYYKEEKLLLEEVMNAVRPQIEDSDAAKKAMKKSFSYENFPHEMDM